MLSSQKKFFNELFGGVGRALAKLPIHPNFLTLLGLGLVVACCFYLIMTKNLLVFSVLIFFAGLFDLLDGALARASGKSSKFGAYLDAMTDRYFEILVVISTAYVTGYWVLSALLILGTYSVSYAKARAAMEIPIQNNEWPDFLERSERDLIFVAGLFISQVIPVQILEHNIFWWTLLFLTLGTHATVIQRVFRARRLIKERAQL
jgi:phosphatidylglycerophosphate synthase